MALAVVVRGSRARAWSLRQLPRVVASRCFASQSHSDGGSSSIWSHLGEAPLDGNHATNAAFEGDPSPLKVNLGRGVYKDDAGKNWVLPSVRQVRLPRARESERASEHG